MVRLFITNLKREIGTKKEKNLSTRIACRGSRLVEVTGLEPAHYIAKMRLNQCFLYSCEFSCELKPTNKPPYLIW